MGPTAIACLVSLLALHDAPLAAAPTDPRGSLIDPVESPSEPGQRYVLYVPSTVDPQKAAPILYIMDYRGRGRIAAELFRPAAEQLGWILISSYNTASDGSGEPNAVALRTMWRDSHDRFAIDDRRTYLAGLSGTARVAALIAAQTGTRFAGVIGAAAGFPPAMPPTKDARFLYFGTAGTIDYNYWEMRGLETQLSRLGLPHRIAFFDGPHGWMPPDLALAALAWMELRAMQAGHRPVDRAFVGARWSRDLERARALEAQGLAWEASRLLASMTSDYAGLRAAGEIADLGRQAEQLAATPAAIDQARRQAGESARHERRIDAALQVLSDAYPAGADTPAMLPAKTILDLDIARLRQAAARAGTEEGLAASRIMAQLDVQTGFYLPLSAMNAGDNERARFYLTVAAAINPENPHTWFLVGALEARLRHPGRAVEAIARAISLGFRTVDALEHDPSFDGLRQQPEFVRLLDDLREEVR